MVRLVRSGSPRITSNLTSGRRSDPGVSRRATPLFPFAVALGGEEVTWSPLTFTLRVPVPASQGHRFISRVRPAQMNPPAPKVQQTGGQGPTPVAALATPRFAQPGPLARSWSPACWGRTGLGPGWSTPATSSTCWAARPPRRKGEPMKVLTVYAHHNPRSFCHGVLEHFTQGLPRRRAHQRGDRPVRDQVRSGVPGPRRGQLHRRRHPRRHPGADGPAGAGHELLPRAGAALAGGPGAARQVAIRRSPR